MTHPRSNTGSVRQRWGVGLRLVVGLLVAFLGRSAALGEYPADQPGSFGAMGDPRTELGRRGGGMLGGPGNIPAGADKKPGAADRADDNLEPIVRKPSQEMVLDVLVMGNKSVPITKIMPHIRTRPGRPFDLEMIEEDVRRLDATHLFVDVRTYFQQVDGGRLVYFQVFERPLLTDVLFVGCKEIHKKVLQKEAKLKTGDAADPFIIEEARRALEQFYHEKGFAKARITMLEGDKPEDRRAIFLINEGVKQKVWSVNFVGNTIASDDRLRTQIKSKHPFLYLFGGEFDRKQVDTDRELLVSYYRDLGFFRARVGFEPSFNEKENWVTITFVIDEGPRYKIRDVSIVGNTKYASEELLSGMKLKKAEYFNRPKQLSDIAGMQDKYGSIGYVFSDIKGENLFLEEPGQLDLVYHIKEGDQYSVGKIDIQIKGEYPHTREYTILNRLSIKPGDIVDIREIRDSETRIKRSQLFESDPAKGNVPKIGFSPPDQEQEKKTEVAEKPDKPQKRSQFRGQSPDPQPRTWCAQYTPNAGQSTPTVQRPPLQWTAAQTTPTATDPAAATTVGTAAVPASNANTVANNTTVQATAAPQAAPVQPAPQYGQQTYLGPLFDPNSPFNGGPPDAGLGPRPLDFNVAADEAMTGRIMLGVGVNSDSGLVGTVLLEEQNFDWTRFPTGWEDIRNNTAFRGNGQRFRLEAVPGTSTSRYAVTFEEPYLFNSRVAFGVSGYYYTRFYTEYHDQRLGGRTWLGYMLTHDLSASVAYSGAKINISNPIDPDLEELEAVVGRDLARHAFDFTLTHNKRDNNFLPTQGHYFEATIGEVLGSFQYPHAEADLRKYFHLYERPDGSGRHVVSLSARAGWTGDNTPIYDRYYAGGFTTIRGFQFRGVSPTEIGPTTHNPIIVGGKFELLASAEYLFPITADDMLRAVVFCDTGTVEPSINHWVDRYRVAPGVGLRIAIPAMAGAPIALDFAFPVSWERNDSKEVFSFFMGFLR